MSGTGRRLGRLMMSSETTTLPARGAVAAQLAAALAELLAAEEDVMRATLSLLEARRHLLQAEDRVLLADPPILDGKNAEVRAAQLRAATTFERDDVDAAERERTGAISALDRARECCRTWRSTAALVAVPE